MADIVNMPRFKDTMEEGVVATWLKKVGDKVSEGDILVEIETDKATMEVEAVDEGKVAKLIVEEGTSNIPVNSTIAILDGDDKDQNEGDQDQTKDTVGKIKKKEIQYFILLRFIPMPFIIQNAILVLLNISRIKFIISTIFGITPYIIIFSFVFINDLSFYL